MAADSDADGRACRRRMTARAAIAGLSSAIVGAAAMQAHFALVSQYLGERGGVLWCRNTEPMYQSAWMILLSGPVVFLCVRKGNRLPVFLGGAAAAVCLASCWEVVTGRASHVVANVSMATYTISLAMVWIIGACIAQRGGALSWSPPRK